MSEDERRRQKVREGEDLQRGYLLKAEAAVEHSYLRMPAVIVSSRVVELAAGARGVLVDAAQRATSHAEGLVQWTRQGKLGGRSRV